MTIFVGNLSFKADEEAIKEYFSQYGSVKQVKLPLDMETGRKRGFAFVEFENESQEQEAIDKLDGTSWMGRDLRVNKAEPRGSRPPAGRRDRY
jgi:RNA recognition motif-containing protein